MLDLLTEYWQAPQADLVKNSKHFVAQVLQLCSLVLHHYSEKNVSSWQMSCSVSLHPVALSSPLPVLGADLVLLVNLLCSNNSIFNEEVNQQMILSCLFSLGILFIVLAACQVKHYQ